MAGGPQYGAPMAPPPAKKRGKGLWIVLGILGFFVVGIGGCVFFVFGAVTGAADAGNEFIALLDEGNIPAAYEAFDESCRDFSQEELAGVLGGADITDYNLNNSSINSSNGVTRGTVSGTIELDGSPVPVTIELVKNGDWEVCGFFLGN